MGIPYLLGLVFIFTPRAFPDGVKHLVISENIGPCLENSPLAHSS